MAEKTLVPVNLVAELLRNLGPDFTHAHVAVLGFPQPWLWTLLHPQSLPPVAGPLPDPWSARSAPTLPGELVAVAYADAQLYHLGALGHASDLFGEPVAGRATARGLRIIGEADELCPRWPLPVIPWPWPTDPPRPPHPDENMSATESLAYGSRLLGGAAMLGSDTLAGAVTDLAHKSIRLGIAGAG